MYILLICLLYILYFIDYGNCLLEHMLISGGFSTNTRIGNEFNIDTDIQKLMNCFVIAENFLDNMNTLKEVRFNLTYSKIYFSACYPNKLSVKIII